MPLQMKSECEKCGEQINKSLAKVYICSFECTFCKSCSESLIFVCPNCQGELVVRPRRIEKSS